MNCKTGIDLRAKERGLGFHIQITQNVSILTIKRKGLASENVLLVTLVSESGSDG